MTRTSYRSMTIFQSKLLSLPRPPDLLTIAFFISSYTALCNASRFFITSISFTGVWSRVLCKSASALSSFGVSVNSIRFSLVYSEARNLRASSIFFSGAPSAMDLSIASLSFSRRFTFLDLLSVTFESPRPAFIISCCDYVLDYSIVFSRCASRTRFYASSPVYLATYFLRFLMSSTYCSNLSNAAIARDFAGSSVVAK